MARPTTKTDLQSAAGENYEKLTAMIAGMTEKELNTPFDFSGSASKKEAHWKRDRNLRDVLIHLYEWHQLLLNWVRANYIDGKGENGADGADADGAPVRMTARGKKKETYQSLLPQPYNWKTYGDMNVEFWKKHQGTTLDEAKELFRTSHGETMKLIESLSNEELFSVGVFPWTGGSTLGSYFAANTSSHYDWAMKKLKAHKKNCSHLS